MEYEKGITNEEYNLIVSYIELMGFKRVSGFVVNTQEMNPENYDEIYYEGSNWQEALGDYVRQTKWWSYEPSDGVVLFESIFDALEYAEDNNEISFERWKGKSKK